MRESISPVERLEAMLHPWAGFVIMPLFAVANAGVTISAVDIGQMVSVAVFAGLALGKPIGVLLFTWLAVRLGFAVRPQNLSWPFLAAGAFLTGIGFTMSLLVASLAYGPAMLNEAKVGVLAGSLSSAVVGLTLLIWLIWQRQRQTD